MQSNQYSVKVFETTVHDEEKFLNFFETNYILFKDHLILIQGDLSPKIRNFLDEQNFNYLHNIDLPRGRSRPALEEELKIEEQEHKLLEDKLEKEIQSLKNKLDSNCSIMDTIIRSGQNLNIDGHLILFNRINNGAKLTISGSLIVTQIVDGEVVSNGNFMLLVPSSKASIIFHGVNITKELESSLNKVEFKDNEIIITSINEKDIAWV